MNVLEEDSVVDFAAAAYMEDGAWRCAGLPVANAEKLDVLAANLRRFTAEGPAIGLISVDGDFFVLLRVSHSDTRLLLSDVTAAPEYAMALEALDLLGVDLDLDSDAVEPAGDLGLFADFGMPAAELATLCDDIDMFPEDVLLSVATRIGFGPALAELLDGTSG